MSPGSQFFFVEAQRRDKTNFTCIGPITMSGTLIGLFVTVALPSRKKTAPPPNIRERQTGHNGPTVT